MRLSHVGSLKPLFGRTTLFEILNPMQILADDAYIRHDLLLHCVILTKSRDRTGGLIIDGRDDVSMTHHRLC
jgi:hypothetical protein